MKEDCKKIKDEVIIINYNEIYLWSSKDAAIAFYKEALYSRDPGSNESQRYRQILDQLYDGKKICSDEEE